MNDLVCSLISGVVAQLVGKPSSAPVIVSATLGTLADPISAGSTVNKTTTWVQMQSLPVPTALREFTVYATATGSIKLKVFQPIKGGGFNVISNQTLTIGSTGVTTFSVAGGTLTEVAMPANCLVGFHTPSSGGATVSFKSGESPAYSAGYLAGSGDLSGNGVALTASAAYGNELQSQYVSTFTRGVDAPGTYWIDEDFASTIAPAFGVNQATNAWSFAVAGQTTSAGTGLANFYDFYPTTNADRCTFAVEFEFTAGADRFAIYRKPILGDASAAEGTIGEADLANNRLVMYATWAGSGTITLPAVASTLALTNLTLTTGVRYRLELTKTAKVNSLRIINTVTLAEQTLSVDNDPTNLSGLGYGRPGFANLAGSCTVKAAQFYPLVTHPRVLIFGDSITEGSGTDQETSYAQLVLDGLATPGAGWYSGDGGTTAANALRRIRHDLRLSVPRYVVVYIGANNATTAPLATAFETDIQAIYNTIVNAGATPVICTLTPNSDATQNGRVGTMNTFLLARGWTLARFDLALGGVGGNTYNAALMADGVHPNTAGHALLAARLEADWPAIFA